MKSLSYERLRYFESDAEREELLRKAHQTLKRITRDFEQRWHFNASVALIMELFNELHAQEPLSEGANPAVIKKVFEMMVLMIAPLLRIFPRSFGRCSGIPAGL